MSHKDAPRSARDLMPASMLTAVCLFSLLVLINLAVVLWLSFTSGAPGDAALVYTTQNFTEVFADPRTWRVLVDTFAFASVTLIIALAIGIPAAWLVERTDFSGKTLLFTLMAIGLLIPGFAAAMGWLFMLHPRIGLINQFFIQNFGTGPVFSISRRSLSS
jgi:iron(III) transport system permease protein